MDFNGLYLSYCPKITAGFLYRVLWNILCTLPIKYQHKLTNTVESLFHPQKKIKTKNKT